MEYLEESITYKINLLSTRLHEKSSAFPVFLGINLYYQIKFSHPEK